jgi:E3 ubiquitin-protein ligase ATL4
MDALPPPAPPAAGDPFAATLPPSLPSPPPPSFNLSPSLLIIAALLAFVVFASVSIHLLLRCLARSSSSHRGPSPLPTRARRASEEEAEVGSTRRSAAAVAPEEAQPAEEVVDDEKERLIASLPLFTMASALAALPKSSPDCAVCLSPFSPDAELRLLPSCRHAFHAACVDAWLRTTPSCPLCRAAVSLPHPPLPTAPPTPPAAGPAQAQEPLDSRVSSSNNSRSFRVEIGSVSNRRSSAAGDDRRTYSLGSFDFRVDEEVEAVVARITRPAAAVSAAAAKSATHQAAPATPGEALAEAAGSRGWLREYVDRLASSASSLSGRWSARWSQGQGHHSRSQSQGHRQDDSWRWDPEAVTGAAMHRAPDEEEPAFVALYRWIVGV